ncbi:uncharacterized protein LOC130738135 [Lotus japonicus]|uniref:uncharacterized protein LOC130738135 n=1 Tax=Lotus japonicus TaxID=34305 RepID=UPI002588333F|nr:uncharacterized protein LOC130738135 [Lotus japonicus]
MSLITSPVEEDCVEEERDASLIVFDDADVAEALGDYVNCLVGRFLTDKPIHRGSLQSALGNIWCNPRGFRVEEINSKVFLFHLDEEKDAKRILQGSPWVFRNSWLLIQPWNRHVEPVDMAFNSVAIWVQLWGLPLHCRTLKMGTKVGSVIGEVLDVDLFELPDKRVIVKVLVEMNVMKPLLSGINGGSHKDGVFWIDFKYEKLPQFCFICGRIGHGDQFCPLNNDGEPHDLVQRKYGPRLRVSMSGRRFLKKSDAATGARHGTRGERTVNRDVAPEILERFARLSVAGRGGGSSPSGAVPVTENVTVTEPSPPTPTLGERGGSDLENLSRLEKNKLLSVGGNCGGSSCDLEAGGTHKKNGENNMRILKEPLTTVEGPTKILASHNKVADEPLHFSTVQPDPQSELSEDNPIPQHSLRRFKKLGREVPSNDSKEHKVVIKESNKRQMEDSEMMPTQISEFPVEKKQCVLPTVEAGNQPRRQP